MLGAHPTDKKPVELHAGRYGPYVKHGSVNATLPDRDQADALTLDEAVALLDAKAGRATAAPAAKKPRKTPRQPRGRVPRRKRRRQQRCRRRRPPSRKPREKDRGEEDARDSGHDDGEPAARDRRDRVEAGREGCAEKTHGRQVSGVTRAVIRGARVRQRVPRVILNP